MKKFFLILFCLAICAPAWTLKAATTKRQTSKSATTAKKTTPTKKTTTRRRRRRSTRFVPKQKAPTADRVKEIQGALAQGGYYDGDLNGKWDSKSVAALEKFQSANGMEPTGKLDASSLQKLGLGSDIAGVSAPRPPVPAVAVPQTSAPPSQDSSPKPAAPAASTAPASDTSTAAAIAPPTGNLESKSPQQ
ncbi:MAG TPA: peptidoglycan-binding domain-containing protein [Candidatus Acidoferrales bacterium]|nr:peptidoglycan-binding domain-containing protein [Candidatus Acidoferrales bacterium]